MTWTKLGDEFSDDAAKAGLTDAAFRTHVEAIQWLYRVESGDCVIPRNLVRRFAGSEDYERAIKELVALGLWAEAHGSYVVLHQGDVIRQSLAAQEAKRARDRTHKQVTRGQKKVDGVASDVGSDVDSDSASDVGSEIGGVASDVAAPQTDKQTSFKGERVRGEADWPKVRRPPDHGLSTFDDDEELP